MPEPSFTPAKFELGHCYISARAFDALANFGITPATLLELHATLATDHLPPEHHQARLAAMKRGEPIVSKYRVPLALTRAAGPEVWITTEPDRAMTTVLLKSEV